MKTTIITSLVVLCLSFSTGQPHPRVCPFCARASARLMKYRGMLERVEQKVSSNEIVLQKMKEMEEKGSDEEAVQKWSNKENVKMIGGVQEKTNCNEKVLQKFATDTTGKEYIKRLGKKLSIQMKTKTRRSGY